MRGLLKRQPTVVSQSYNGQKRTLVGRGVDAIRVEGGPGSRGTVIAATLAELEVHRSVTDDGVSVRGRGGGLAIAPVTVPRPPLLVPSLDDEPPRLGQDEDDGLRG